MLSPCLIALWALMAGASSVVAADGKPFMHYDTSRTRAQLADAIETGSGLDFDNRIYTRLLEQRLGLDFGGEPSRAAAFIRESPDIWVADCRPAYMGDGLLYRTSHTDYVVARPRQCKPGERFLTHHNEPIVSLYCGNPHPRVHIPPTQALAPQPACTVSGMHALREHPPTTIEGGGVYLGVPYFGVWPNVGIYDPDITVTGRGGYCSD